MPRADQGTAASETNSELTIILSAADEALRQIPFGHPAREMLIQIQAAGSRLTPK